jgi:hypothetical protein
MKRTLKAAICIGALALPAVALGGPPPDPEYGGKIDGKKSRYIGFDIKGSGNNRTLKNMFIVNVPFHDCDDPADDGKQGGGFEGAFDIDGNGRFGGTETDMFRRHRGTPTGLKYTLKGKVDGNRAEGSLETKVLGTNCKSGKVEWEAKKPAPPVPQS